MAHIAGLVAAGVHPSPVPHADFVSTTTHKTLRGPRGGLILCREKYAKDLDRSTFPGIQGGPLMHIIAAKAVCLKEAAEPGFREYQRQVVANAKALAAGIAERGYRIVSGGTDNHLFLVDIHSRGLTGADAQPAFDRAGITINKNSIPFDPLPPMKASGIRMGTPAVTTRGMREPEMDQNRRTGSPTCSTIWATPRPSSASAPKWPPSPPSSPSTPGDWKRPRPRSPAPRAASVNLPPAEAASHTQALTPVFLSAHSSPPPPGYHGKGARLRALWRFPMWPSHLRRK